MNSEPMFTQNSKLLEIRKKQLFLSIGLLPILLFGIFFTWFGTVGSRFFGIDTEQLLFLTPIIIAVQMIFLVIKRNAFRWKHVKLSSESIMLLGDRETSIHKLKDLEKMRVKRDEDNRVQKIIMNFGKVVIRLEGYLEMNSLRDTILIHQKGQMNARFRLIDVQ